MKNYCIYYHQNKVNGKVYVGQTNRSLMDRFGQDGKKYSNNLEFWSDIKTFGWDNFDHLILLDNLNKEEADYYEDFFIKLFNSTESEFGYNHKGGGSAGFIPQYIRAKIANAHAGKPLSEEHKAKIRAGCIGINKGTPSPRKGQRVSDTHRQHIANANKGKNVGRIWIHNDSNTKFIKPDQLSGYIAEGYCLGRN